MFEGIGIFTIIGTLTTIGIGITTPLDCYVGLSSRSKSETFKIKQPAGHLGCQYDIDNLRIFAEHISSPATKEDHPGINHLGVKGLMPLGDDTTAYVGASYALTSEQYTGSDILSMAGIEIGKKPVVVYGEYIMSIDRPSEGTAIGGIKFIF